MLKKIVFILSLFFLTQTSFGQRTLHIYGGKNHDVYLGCVNCNEYDQNSIWNEYSKYGNSFNSNSIWNEFGTYGNKFSLYSPWNPIASYTPVIVDKEGNFYGYFTVNEYHSKRWESSLALTIYEYYDKIMDDVSEWYGKIFN